MRPARTLGALALIFTLLTWGYFLFLVPTFDFDESLFRRVAEEMKHSHQYWQMTWDHWPVYHKPPIFYWLICGFSQLIDGPDAGVSALAARLPNFFASLGILASLFWAGNKLSNRKLNLGLTAVLAFCSGLFPVMTSVTVIFDPLQTLVLMPSLILPTLVFFRDFKLKPLHWLLWGFSLFLACAVKGLNGIVVPSFALALHLMFTLRRQGFAKNFQIGVHYLIRAFLPACLLTAAFYAWLDLKLGHAFTHEYLWVQHFERTQIPMEQHSGFFLYHFLVVFFGAGFLAPLAFTDTIARNSKRSMNFSRDGFPLSFVLAFVVVFSFSATKLPHYTWPAWPALALFYAVCSARLSQESEDNDLPERPSARLARGLFLAPVFLLALAFSALAGDPKFLLIHLSKGVAYQDVLLHFNGFTFWERSGFVLGGASCFLAALKPKVILRSIERGSFFAAVSTFFLTVGLGRTAKELMVVPFEEISTALKTHGAKPGTCIRSTGAQSPTFSLALGLDLLHNRCEPQDMQFLVAPEWKAAECETRGMARLEQKSYLVLCGKP